MSEMKALLLDAEARTANLEIIPKPTPGAAEIIVEVKAIALNPIDPLYVAHPLGDTGRVIGSDFAGVVSGLGSEVPSTSGLQKGTHVAGFLQGACSGNPRPGAFAEYLVVPWDLVWKIPDDVELESAAGVSLVALTAAQALWYRLGLPAPFEYDRALALQEHPEHEQTHSSSSSDPHELSIFIYGASTSVGLYAAQMARLSARTSGKTVKLIGAASNARWPMLQAQPYGYEHLVDYHDHGWLEKIQHKTAGTGIHYAYDCISECDSVRKVASLLAPNGKMAIVRSREGGAWTASNLPIEPVYGAVWEGLGEEVQYQGMTVPKSPAARDFAVRFNRWLSEAVGTDTQPVPVRVMPGGLDRVVEDGFALLGSGKMSDRAIERREEWMKPVSGEKLVYRV